MNRRRLAALGAFLVGTGLSFSTSADPTSGPASMLLKVYRFGLSTSPTCENMAVYTVADPQFVDLTSNPTLGSADVPRGTYRCVALEIDGVITAAPRTSFGACTTAPQTSDFCTFADLVVNRPPVPPVPPRPEDPRPGAEAGVRDAAAPMPDAGLPPPPPPPSPTQPYDGVLPLGGDPSAVYMTCPAGGARPVVYLTTQVPSEAIANPFRPPISPTDTAHGHALLSPLVIGERTIGTFVVGMNAISNDGECTLDSPTFAFESSVAP